LLSFEKRLRDVLNKDSIPTGFNELHIGNFLNVNRLNVCVSVTGDLLSDHISVYYYFII